MGLYEFINRLCLILVTTTLATPVGKVKLKVINHMKINPIIKVNSYRFMNGYNGWYNNIDFPFGRTSYSKR